jgi:YHS domain-containing protein
MAELVTLKTSIKQASTVQEGTDAIALPTTVIDVICGMEVEIEGARFTAEHEGTTMYFCCPACNKTFVDDPAGYLTDPNEIGANK